MKTEDIYLRTVLSKNMKSRYVVKSIISPHMKPIMDGQDMQNLVRSNMTQHLAKQMMDSKEFKVKTMETSPEYLGITHVSLVWSFDEDKLTEIIKKAFNDGVEVGKMEYLADEDTV